LASSIARGIAILGTLATNIWIFTDPGGIVGYLERPLPSLTGGLEQTVQTITRQLANGKFLGMLTLMFGVGLELQRRSARGRGRPWPGRYPWRASLLFLDGLLHYLLVVEMLFEQRGRALRRRMMALGLGLALPIDLAIGSLGGAAGLVFARYATAPLVAAGLLGAAACLVELRRSPGAVQRRLADGSPCV
jgi:hypothetical protein